jgi:hypothetical protein
MDLDMLDLQVRTGITQMQKDCEEEESTVQQVQQIMRTYEFVIVPVPIQHICISLATVLTFTNLFTN